MWLDIAIQGVIIFAVIGLSILLGCWVDKNMPLIERRSTVSEEIDELFNLGRRVEDRHNPIEQK